MQLRGLACFTSLRSSDWREAGPPSCSVHWPPSCPQVALQRLQCLSPGQGCTGFGPGLPLQGTALPTVPFTAQMPAPFCGPSLLPCEDGSDTDTQFPTGGGRGRVEVGELFPMTHMWSLPFVPIITARPTVSSPLELNCLVSTQ